MLAKYPILHVEFASQQVHTLPVSILICINTAKKTTNNEVKMLLLV